MKKSKVVEILWSLTLLTCVVVSCFYLLLLGGKCYQTVIANTNQAEDERLPISFIATSLRQSNKDQVSIETIEETDCLVIEFDDYVKYIYAYDGQLREMIALPNTTFKLSSGEIISRVSTLNFDLDGQVLNYSIKVDQDEYEMKVAMR
ncbi:DUF4860 domain-containing protein [Anaerorhabdus sp.]|uniref:DUF4860 domain-containing protein n=1 Tax=Anaerorhabdus sp. TaxID=1872524 RepID=UPI002FC7B484